MPERLVSLVREIVGDGLRRLTGRRSRPRYLSPAPVAPTPPSQSQPPSDPWAAQVLEYAERAVRNGVDPREDGDGRGTPFELLDLGLLPDAIAHIVRVAAPVREGELVPRVRAELLLGEIPANYERLLGRFVWSAKGRRLIDLRDGAWVAGTAEPEPIAQLEGRSLDGLARMAGELAFEDEASEDGVFRAVLADLVGDGERAPRIVAIAAGAAIGLARRRGDLPHDRWGQQSLLEGVDG